MKRIVAFLLIITMLMGFCVTASAMQFKDLNEKHWSYANIQKLVSEGTIKGYPDGSFRPEANVTRAEFAKMFGEGKAKNTRDFKDLDKSHWSYSYVMASGVDSDKDYFRPDEYMTRGEVLDALWDRCGVKVDAKVPGVIARQFENEDAVTWAYTTQLMKGNDGIDLRLSDSITRAEVAALIIRVRNLDTKNLKKITDNISENLLTKINDTIDLFGGKYQPDKKLTYGQVAHASLLLAYGTDEYAPAGNFVKGYDGEYSDAMSAMTVYVWDKSKNTKEYANKNITVQDALLAVMNAAVISSSKDIPVGSEQTTYKDAVSTDNFMNKIYMAYAYNNGVFNTLDGTLNAKGEITMKEFMSLVIQVDRLGGFAKSFTNGITANEEILKDTDGYSKNYKDYAVVLKGIPAYIYSNAGFAEAPKKAYYEVNNFETIFKTYFEELLIAENRKTTHKLTYTYYPSLTSIVNGNIQFVLKLQFANVAKGTTFASVFPVASGNKQLIEEGKTYYVLVSAGVPFSDYIPADNTQIVKIIAAY